MVFMKNDENTSSAASHAALRINIAHLAFRVDADDSPGLNFSLQALLGNPGETRAEALGSVS
jgi:hypothetical protein